jgi:hypothetical protein
VHIFIGGCTISLGGGGGGGGGCAPILLRLFLRNSDGDIDDFKTATADITTPLTGPHLSDDCFTIMSLREWDVILYYYAKWNAHSGLG